MIDTDTAEQILQGDDTHPDILQALGLELLAEVWHLRQALITVQRSLIWDEEDRALDGDLITLEALVAQVEQVRSDITSVWLRGETYEF